MGICIKGVPLQFSEGTWKGQLTRLKKLICFKNNIYMFVIKRKIKSQTGLQTLVIYSYQQWWKM